MGWFDEQIRERIKNDNEMLGDALGKMTEAVSGRSYFHEYSHAKAAENAVNEILAYYGAKPRDIPKRITELDEKLEYLMRPFGIMRRRAALTGDWYKSAGVVMLAVTTDGNIAALIPDNCGYTVNDYKSGTRVRITAKNADMFMRDAYCFYKPLPLNKMTAKDFIGYIIKCIDKVSAAKAALVTLAAALVGAFIPMINNLLFNNVILNDNMTVLIPASILFFGIIVSRSLLAMAKDLSLSQVKNKLRLQIESAVMMRILAMPSSFFRTYSAGTLSDRTSNAGDLSDIICDILFSVVISAVFSAVYFVQIYIYTPMLLLPSLAIAAAIMLFSTAAYFSASKEIRFRMEYGAKERGLLFSLISGIQKIKLSGSEKRAFSKWAKSYSQTAKYTYNPPYIIRLGSVIAAAIPLAGIIWVYYSASKGGIDAADYMTFNAAFGMLMGIFSDMYSKLFTAANISPLVHMLEPILTKQPEISGGKTVVTSLSGSIELNNVSFRYAPDMPWVIENLSLKLRPGQYTAIVGTTGCGKSTLIRLLLGFEKPQKGAIYYDGRDINTLDLKSLRRKMGIVLQDGKLFDGDIFSNITIAAPNMTLDEAWEAAEAAGAADDIRAMPMGMNTLISGKNGGISGGQRQRILIARAIATKPKILIFDEATSALDNITQKRVSESLSKLKCTRLVIAHRLSTIRDCSRIIVLDKGHIVEDGKYDTLIDKDGVFAELVKRQQIDE